MPARDLVVVTWIDIASRADWMDQEEAEGCLPEVCVTVGWIVREDKDRLILADSATASGDWGGTTVIPKSVIKKKKRIAQSRPESFLIPPPSSHRKKSKARLSTRPKSED